MIHRLLFNAVLLLSLAYALRRGGTPERIGAWTIIVGDILTILVQRAYAERFSSLGLGVLVVDALMLVAFFLLSLKANRFWPMWMTGLQGVSVMVHAAMALNPGVIPWAYAFGLAIWSYPILILLAVATRRHQERLLSAGADPSWSVSSPLSPPTRREPPGR